MKKIYIVMAALAAVTLFSCEREKSFEDMKPVGENDIAFFMEGINTRSMDATSERPVQMGKVFEMGSDGKGTSVSLEETIEELNPISPATRGVPAYTFNLGKVYKDLGVYGAYKNGNEYIEGDFGDAVFQVMDEAELSTGGWRYAHNYGRGKPWPDETTDVEFYLRMPATQTGVEDLDYDHVNKQITFTYNNPTNGAAQQDILFSHTTLNMQKHDGYLPNGAPVTMYHALTGVKFRNGHSNDGTTKTVIKSVTFKGIKSYGECTVTPDGDGTSKNKVAWDKLDNAATFTMSFNNPGYNPKLDAETVVDDEGKEQVVYHPENNPDGTIAYGSDSQFAGTSWVSAAADHNLNDEDGSMTFWFIPQTIDESATLEVTFVVKTPDTPTGTEVTHIIDFGKEVTKTTGEGDEATKTYTEWKAGQLRTYTLKPFDVDVEIFDHMDGLLKDSLHVTNTGNVDEYVRIMVIGNWYGWKSEADMNNKVEPMILVGYTTDGTTGDDTMVDPWFRENPTYSSGFDETFPGGRPLASSKWKRGTGSYFYYEDVIGAGVQLSGTDAVFQHYELKQSMIPKIYIPVSNQATRIEAAGVHLVMEVVVQAIPTTDKDGKEFKSCWEAWSYATGETIKAK